jgi:hypothetical protein
MKVDQDEKRLPIISATFSIYFVSPKKKENLEEFIIFEHVEIYFKSI